MPELSCCPVWNKNKVLAQTSTLWLVEDGFPVRKGHALVVPKRHVERFAGMTDQEVRDLRRITHQMSEHTELMIAVNDGQAAGRTVRHLHIHLIPISQDDPLPRGGIRSLFFRAGQDPLFYLNAKQDRRPT